MATLTRFTVDLVTEEELSQRRMDSLARELTDHLHVLGVETEDQANVQVDKHVTAHVHDCGDGDRCSFCLEYSRDYRNGDIVVANG